MSDIHDRIAALEAQLAELKLEVVSHEAEASTSRREVFKKLAIGAAGVAAGGVLLGKATPAAALAGDPILIGAVTNTSTAYTRADYTGTGTGAAFLIQSGNDFTNAVSNYPAALAAWATASGPATYGVYGWTAKPNGAGIVGRGSTGVTGTVGGQFLGDRASINLVSNGTQASVVASIAKIKKGDLVFTNEGDVWLGDADGSLVRLGGTSTAAANGLYFLDAPARAYDSRSGTGAGFGVLTAAGGARKVSLATGTSAGATVPAVPNGATGALVSVTLDSTVGSGFLAVFAGDIAWPGSSNLNWYATGQILAVTTVSVVDATSHINLQVGGSGSTQTIVDVIGYYA